MIIVAGEALIDRIVRPDGRTVEVPGGGPFNTARTIARLGVDVAFLGRLSTDAAGERLRAALVADGVDLRWAVATDAPTTVAIAELDAEGVATYRFELEGTSAPGLELDDVLAAFHDGPTAVHLGSLGLAVEPIASALAAGLPRLGSSTLVVVDPNCRPAAIEDREAYVGRLRAVLARADVVKASADDLAVLAPSAELVAAARWLLELGPSVVLLTDGARSVQVIGASIDLVLPVPRVEVIDTVGSGDAFGGAFLARFIEHGGSRAALGDAERLDDAVEAGIEVAGLTCQRAGADPPHRAELGWPRIGLARSRDGLSAEQVAAEPVAEDPG